MHTATLAFGTMERRADRTLGLVLFAKHVRTEIMGIVLFSGLVVCLRSLVHLLSSTDKLNALSSEQALELTGKLKQIYMGLDQMLSHGAIPMLRRKFIVGKIISDLEELTEDLYDVMEGLALSENAEFRALIADCVRDATVERAPEPVGRV
jgi:hypothetical protein